MLNLNKINTFYHNFVPLKRLHDVICWQDNEKKILRVTHATPRIDVFRLITKNYYIKIGKGLMREKYGWI